MQLGLGLIGIGKPWGVDPHPVPHERDAISLLEFAFELGIRYFDTAPSYGDGVSEQRLGRFLKALTPAERDQVTAATKFGEHWNPKTNGPYADHSYGGLSRSLDVSISRLGRVDVLQLHKTTPQALATDAVARAWVGRLSGYSSDRPQCERSRIGAHCRRQSHLHDDADAAQFVQRCARFLAGRGGRATYVDCSEPAVRHGAARGRQARRVPFH